MFTVIRSITDKALLIKYNEKLYILKTYNNIQSKKNTIKYINILKQNSIDTLQYFEFDFLESNQLCLEYVMKFYTFDKRRTTKDYQIVGKYFSNIHKQLESGIGNVDNSNIMIDEDNVYFLNPDFGCDKDEDIELFLMNNLKKSRNFTSSLNQQETVQNEFLDSFELGYKS